MWEAVTFEYAFLPVNVSISEKKRTIFKDGIEGWTINKVKGKIQNKIGSWDEYTVDFYKETDQNKVIIYGLNGEVDPRIDSTEGKGKTDN